MPRKPSLRALEVDAERFATPTTEKERAIMDAAVALIGERGVDGATTAAIAKRAGVTERTLFRYFPSKKDLVRRVLVPLLSGGAVSQQYDALAELIGNDHGDFREWYASILTARFDQIARDPVRVRTVIVEVLQNEEVRAAMAALWERVWRPLLAQLKKRQAAGELRKDLDVEVLARAIHYFQAGYTVTRFVFAPDHKWDDEEQLAQMADLLTYGCLAKP
jgi:TetR/AcrR family transcriptional regulator